MEGAGLLCLSGDGRLWESAGFQKRIDGGVNSMPRVKKDDDDDVDVI